MAEVLELPTLAMSGMDRLGGVLASLGLDTDVVVIGQHDCVFGCRQMEPADVDRSFSELGGVLASRSGRRRGADLNGARHPAP